MRFNRTQRILMGIVTVLLVFTILFNVTRSSNRKDYLESTAYTGFSMIRHTLVDNPVESVADFVHFWGNYYQINQENIILRSQIDSLAAVQARLNEAQRQIDELQALNDMQEVNSEYTLVNATVINRSADNWNNTMLINAGLNDGIQNNNAVMTPQGLVGKVINADNNSSIVELMTTTNKTNKVSVKIEHDDFSTSDAILEYYDSEKQAYKMTLLDTNVTISVGSTVTTSGMGGVFPSGILVGTVVSADLIEDEVSMNIYVSPSADFSNINYVQVIQRGDLENAD